MKSSNIKNIVLFFIVAVLVVTIHLLTPIGYR